MTAIQILEAAIATVSGISFVYGVTRPLDTLAGQKYLYGSAAGFIVTALLGSFSA